MGRLSVTVLASALLLAACSQLIGPTFSPAEQLYLDHLHQADNQLVSTFTDVDLVEIGTQVCDAAAEGTINDATVIAAESLNQDAYNQPVEQLVTEYIRLVVTQALIQLCPAQAKLLNS